MTAERNERKKADWFVRFAWLIHDSKSHIFRKVCVHAKAKNVFVTGKDWKEHLAKRDICRPPEIDVTAEAPETDGLRHCERGLYINRNEPGTRLNC